MCLSTLECAAVALSILEKNEDIQEVFMSLEGYVVFESRSLVRFYLENLEMHNLLNL